MAQQYNTTAKHNSISKVLVNLSIHSLGELPRVLRRIFIKRLLYTSKNLMFMYIIYEHCIYHFP